MERLTINTTKIEQKVTVFSCDMCGEESPCILIVMGDSPGYPPNCSMYEEQAGKSFRWFKISEPPELEIVLRK